ncbi:MAG: hypothetical protein V2I54_11865 [Bacteroidales bacterium]|jgi:hypothetical protein|nr:hypothetical protein [Bacteroidales bacterium]
MSEKGFDLKVLIPTDDGLTISANGIQRALYYLMYNVSNRSYQLAGKGKTSEWYRGGTFLPQSFHDLINQEKVDLVITRSAISHKIYCDNQVAEEKDISTVLNHLIDRIDQKKS